MSPHLVQFTDADRVGVYFLEFGAAPDRAGSSTTGPTRPWPTSGRACLTGRKILGGTNWFYVTGITAAQATSAAATLEALQAAKAAGVKTCVDPNYRAKLWSVEQAKTWLTEAINTSTCW